MKRKMKPKTIQMQMRNIKIYQTNVTVHIQLVAIQDKKLESLKMKVKRLAASLQWGHSNL